MSVPRMSGDGVTQVGNINVSTPYEDPSAGVKVEDFLNLMVAQLSNQDFMNPVDDTAYVAQLAQFATMQSMQELSHYSQTNYVSSMVGKTVTVAALGLGGSVSKDTGIVTKVDLSGDEYTVTVNDKVYKLNQIMSISDTDSAVTQNELEAAGKMAPIVQSVGKNSMKLRWDAPIGEGAKQGELRYDVYYTDDPTLDFTTLTGVKKGTLAGEGLSGTELEITGLEPGKTYFVNVVVRNARGDQAVYQHTTRTTAPA